MNGEEIFKIAYLAAVASGLFGYILRDCGFGSRGRSPSQGKGVC